MSRQKIIAISSTDSLISLSSADARTHLYEVSSGKISEKFSIPTYGNSIICGFLSKPFGIFVSGTDDRSLIISLLSSGSTIRIIHLEFIPQKVLVTPHWGFIVVHGNEYIHGEPKYSLAIFNINGTMIKSVQFHAQIDNWLAFTSKRGFDFLIISSQRGKLFAFEAFFLDVGLPIYRCSNDLISLDFTQTHNVILAVSVDGKVHLVPFMTKSVEKYCA
jgi:WD40 repeat protein